MISFLFHHLFQICAKLSGHGSKTAEWVTDIGNELCQILNLVFTDKEAVDTLLPVTMKIEDRYLDNGIPVPYAIFTDRGCCRVDGESSMQKLFPRFTQMGVPYLLDFFHWINRWDAAVTDDHHPMYPDFKSGLAGCGLAYYDADIRLLAKAIRAGMPKTNLTDIQVITKYASKDDKQKYLRRTTIGVQATFERVEKLIEILSGPAGLDENGVPLFRSGEIEKVWQAQQRHIICFQDPPGVNLYTDIRTVVRNGVELTERRTARGTNSLESFHGKLPGMVPGPSAAAQPLQVTSCTIF